MFNHLNIELPEIEPVYVDGNRYYPTPKTGSLYPSITSVTSHYNKEVFKEWRRKVGDKEADRIVKESTTRGTSFHKSAQDYLENKEVIHDNSSIEFMFDTAKPYLDRINNIHAIEKCLYSDHLGIAGRVDCIAEYEGELAIIDFKTSNKIKPEAWIQQYFVQEVAYACMYYEMTQNVVKKLITIMVTPTGEVKVFEKRDKKEYVKLLRKYINQFVEDKLKEYGSGK